jgi:glyoxylase-like metal-dependent hydrolase (beta-lactamase superfamily II)
MALLALITSVPAMAAGAPTAQAAAPLKLEVYTSVGDDLSVNSTIIEGEHDAAIVDAQFTLSNAHRLAAMVLESGKRLTTVYVTHPHPDHFFGLAVLHPAFPDAKLLALPRVLDELRPAWDARYKFWEPRYGANIPADHTFPDALDGNSFMLEGETIKVVGPLQGDSPGDNSYVWIPSIKAVIGGDVLFSSAHIPLGGATKAQRQAWLQVVDGIKKLKPEIVVPGHQGPNAPHDASVLTFMTDYIKYFDVALASSKSADELKSKIEQRFPGLAPEGLLTFSAQAAFSPPKPAAP